MSVKTKSKKSWKLANTETPTRSKRMLRGLDLAECVADIVINFIPLNEISEVYNHTECMSEREWKELIATYQVLYWNKFPQAAEQVVRVLIKDNKIVQPRLLGLDPPDCSQGYWLELDSLGRVIAHVQL